MFDVGISELMVIGVIALVVIGPERLPRVARTVGHLMGRLQRYVSDVKADINRELQLDELKRLQQQVVDQANEVKANVRTEVNSVESAWNETMAPAEPAVPIAVAAAVPIEPLTPTIPVLAVLSPVAEGPPVEPGGAGKL